MSEFWRGMRYGFLVGIVGAILGAILWELIR